MDMNDKTRAALEIDAILELLSAFAVTDLGAAGVRSLSPLDAKDLELERELQREILSLVADQGALLPRQEVSFSEPIERLGGRFGLGTQSLLALAVLLESFDRIQRGISPDRAPLLSRSLEIAFTGGSSAAGVDLDRDDPGEFFSDEAAEQLRVASGLAAKVRSVLDAKGNVRPDASPELAALNSSVRRTRDSLYKSFESYAQQNGAVLGDDTVTRARGRLAVLLPAGHRGRLDGIVHGRSATEKSYYFEPLELVEENNKLQEQQAREEAERERLLLELASLFQEHSKLIQRVGEFVGVFDVRQAAVLFRRDLDADFPQIGMAERGPGSASTDNENDVASWKIHGAKHPLLDPRLRSLRESALGNAGHQGEVVPLEVESGEDRILVITGPNAGGKTVALKTLGVLSYLASCGWPVPISEEVPSRFPRVQRWIAVVGDEQDVMAQRSTFSARLERLKEVWEEADEGTLVLLDEVGSGTNPEEGAALSIALLERLHERGCFAVVTTHLLPVANAALALPGCASLAMELDMETGAPTFKVRYGAPGSSHAIDLARRLGLDPKWVARAEELLGEEQLTLKNLIAETEQARQNAAALEAELSTLRDNERTLQERQEEELRQAREERTSARKKARAELEAFRRSARDELAKEVRKTRSEAKAKGAASLRTVSKEAARRAGKLVNESALAESLTESLAELQQADQAGAAKASADLQEGDAVRHKMLGWTGTMERIHGSKSNPKAEVTVRGKRVRCALNELEGDPSADGGGAKRQAIRRNVPEVKKPMVTHSGADSNLSMELMLVGQRVEPALDRLETYLDQAILSNLEQARVVHGYGSGRLREAVREHLRLHPMVAKVESAPAELGGDGATVVHFRDN